MRCPPRFARCGWVVGCLCVFGVSVLLLWWCVVVVVVVCVGGLVVGRIVDAGRVCVVVCVVLAG